MNILQTPALSLSNSSLVPDGYLDGNAVFSSAASPSQSEIGASESVYALGNIGIDYGTEERKRAFELVLASSLYDSQKLLDYLKKEEVTPESLIWTLQQNEVPVYILLPQGPYAQNGFAKLISLLRGQLDQGVEIIAVAGTIVGKARLLSGAELPIIAPSPQGTFPFSTNEMVLKVLGPPPREPGMAQTIYDHKMAMVNHFLDTVFYQLQNPGLAPEERAINFAATHAFKIKNAFEKAHGNRLVLKKIETKQAPFSPPHSDRWEVMLAYVAPDPAVRIRQSSRIYSFTVDVAPVIPLLVGGITERHDTHFERP